MRANIRHQTLGVISNRRIVRQRTHVLRGAVAISVTSLLALGLIAGAQPVSATGSISLSTSSASIAPATTVDLTAGMPVVGSGTVSQEIVQQLDPTRVKLTRVSDITYPYGWTLSYCTGASTDCTVSANFSSTTPATAAEWADVKAIKASGPVVTDNQSDPGGRQVARSTVTGPTTTQTPATLNVAAGVDGFSPFFDAAHTRVFNLYHHQATGQIDCWVRLTGARCNGFPFTYGDPASERAFGRVVGTKIWVQGVGGLRCVDISAVVPGASSPNGGGLPQMCTTPLVTLRAGAYFNTFTGASTSGDTGETTLWTLDSSATKQTAYCVNTATMQSCGSVVTEFDGVAATNPFEYDQTNSSIVKWADRIYITPRDWNRVVCYTTTGARCTGWTTAFSTDTNYFENGGSGRVFALPDASGSIEAVCYIGRLPSNTYSRPCWNSSGAQFDLGTKGFPRMVNGLSSIYTVPETQGTRVYIGNGGWNAGGEVICFDAAATAVSGIKRCNSAASNLSIANYSVSPDPEIANCLWVGQHATPALYSLNMLTGTQGCGALAPTKATFSGGSAVPRMGCSSTSSIEGWRSFILDTPTTGFTSATLTVQDSAGLNIPAWTGVALAQGQTVDLSTLPVATTGQTPSFIVELQGTSGSVSVSARITAIGAAPQLCSRATAIAVCPAGPGPIESAMLAASTFGARAWGSSSDGSSTTTLTAVDRSVAISAPTLTQCAGALSGRAQDAGSSPQAVVGATVSLLDSSGNPVVYPADWSDASKRGQAVTTTTDSSGNYSFPNLVVSNYKASFANTTRALVSTATVASGGSGTTNASNGSVVSGASSVVAGGTGVVNAVYNLVAAATADTSTAGQGVTQTISPLSNDSASTNSSFSSSGTAVKLCQPPASAPCALTSVTVNGEGTYTANANGTVTFVPLAGFTGTATPIPYTATDQAGSAASSTITATVVPVPVASADTGTAGWDTNQTFTPIANDTAGSVGGTSYPLSSTSVKICTTSTADSSCTATSNIVVANEGTWSMDPTTGVVTFDPLPSFTGTATPIKYCATDSVSQKVCSTITPTVTAPVAPSAAPETKSVAPGGTVAFSTITGTAGAGGASAGQSLGGLATRATSSSPQFVNASTCLITPGSSPAACDADGIVVVAGEGTYTLNATTGVVSFTALANVAPGTLTPISYKVTDQVGNTATSTLTPVVPVPPTAVNDTSSGGWDSNQTISVPGNDTVSATPATVKLCSSAELAVTPVSSINCTQTSLAVANEGTYTVNGDGSVTFDPLPTFTGTVASPPTYQVADAAGQKARALITPTVAAPPAPSANPDTQVVAPVSAGGTGTVNFDPLLGAGGLATGAGTPTVCLIDPVTTQCAGSNTVTIAGAGTYTLDPTTKVVSFALAAGVTNAGSLAPVTYKVTDSFGQTATSTLTPIIPAPPTATADTSSGYQGVAQVISILGNDSAASGGSLVPSSVKLCDPASNPPQTSPNCTATSVAIANQGTYSVNANGSVTFTPVSNFTGTATAVSYQVADSAGLKASASVTPTVVALPAGAVLPTAATDTKTGSFGQPMTFDFSANTGLTGTNAGNDAAGSAPSSSTSGNVTTSYSTPTLDATSVRLCSSGQVMPNCSATTLTTVDGTYTVNSGGSVTFTPASGFSGTVTQPPTYQVSNSYNKTVATTTTSTVTVDPTSTCSSPSCSFITATDANNVAPGGSGYIPTWTVSDVASLVTPLSYTATALLIPTISAPSGPSASNDSASTTAGTPVSISPWMNDTAGSYALRPGSILLCASGETAPACTQTTVTIAGQGTFSVDTSTGVVTFTPASGFTGTATVPYRILDWNGSATNAVITVTVNAPPSNSGGGSGGGASSSDTTASTSTTPSTPTTPSASTEPSAPSTPTTPAGPKLQPQRDTTIVNPASPVILDPLSNASPTPGASFVASSLRIWDGNSWETTVTVPGVGTWTVIRGKVEFLPARGYTGTATIRVRATDTTGARATNTLKVIVQPRNATIAPKRPALGKVPTAIHAGVVTRSAACPSAAVGGVPAGSITVDGRTVPIKRIGLAADGSLTPPPSNKVAGISSDHAALDATRGATVITWHVRYGPGCDGTLNALLTAPLGGTFTIATAQGASMDYRITERLSVPKGQVKAGWFSAAGPHRLTLLTCSGLKNGHFTQTTYIGAEPIRPA